MAHKWAVDAVDRLLRDLHEVDAPFGGRTILFAGDMQQLLPVHRFAKDPAAYCFKTCAWFPLTKPLSLTVNVRAVADPMWAAFVASVGQGSPAVFPSECIVADVDALIAAVWPSGFKVDTNCCILTMTRDDASMINQRITNAFVGDPDPALSLDTALVSAELCLHLWVLMLKQLISLAGLRHIIISD